MIWSIIPAAGNGTRIQPLAFSKELLPVGSWLDADGVERPRAVSEYLIERLLIGGATRVCFVISPMKTDILQYFGGEIAGVQIIYVSQLGAIGLCDAIFSAASIIPSHDSVLIGLPDTVWYPTNALADLPDDQVSFILFPVENPELFDAVQVDDEGRVVEIHVKSMQASTNWIWGAIKIPGKILHDLHDLWRQRGCRDEFLGSLVNAWIRAGGIAWGLQRGASYVDVGTVFGYREAIRLLASNASPAPISAL